ncbi:MAG: hypothetical protein ACFB02_09460 [Mastigocoleus sp.]
MAIVQQTPNRLTLHFFPWFIWILSGFSLVALPIFFTVVVQSIPQTLTCKRLPTAQINCQLTTFILPPLLSKKVEIKNLQAAKFNRNPEDNNQTQQQQLVLLTKKETVIFSSYKTYKPLLTASKMLDTESRINNFINNSNQQSLELETGNYILYWCLGLITAYSIGFMIIMGEANVCEFHSDRTYMTKKQRWLFLFTKTTKYPLQDIQDVKLEWEYHKMKIYRVTLSLSNGKTVPLSTYYANYLKSQKKIKASAEEIKNFLSLPQI